jgi:hypothetical protein
MLKTKSLHSYNIPLVARLVGEKWMINMFRKCSSDCTHQAVKLCLCSGLFFCRNHSKDHLDESGNHHFVEVSSPLVPEHRTELMNELFSRFQIISQCKSAIAAQASQLIKKIGELSAIALTI